MVRQISVTFIAGFKYKRRRCGEMLKRSGHRFRFDNGHPMDVILPGKADLPLRDDAVLLSVNFAKGILLQLVQSSFTTLECLRAAFPSLKIAQLECPPPNGDNDFIRNNLGRYFEENFQPEQLNALSTPAQRYKFWVLQSQMYAKKCSELAIEYIGVPRTGISDEGFLAPSHYGADSTHANSAYGRLILDLLELRVGGKFDAWNSFG